MLTSDPSELRQDQQGYAYGQSDRNYRGLAVAAPSLDRCKERNEPRPVHRGLDSLSSGLGRIQCFGVEGTGSYGASLTRHLKQRGQVVVEVDRPDRRTRRVQGKSDPVDAEAAARAVLAGKATGSPKTGDGLVEMIRALRVARRSAIKARIQAANQLIALVLTSPEGLRASLRGLPVSRLVDVAARFRPGPLI